MQKDVLNKTVLAHLFLIKNESDYLKIAVYICHASFIGDDVCFFLVKKNSVKGESLNDSI